MTSLQTDVMLSLCLAFSGQAAHQAILPHSWSSSLTEDGAQKCLPCMISLSKDSCSWVISGVCTFASLPSVTLKSCGPKGSLLDLGLKPKKTPHPIQLILIVSIKLRNLVPATVLVSGFGGLMGGLTRVRRGRVEGHHEARLCLQAA